MLVHFLKCILIYKDKKNYINIKVNINYYYKNNNNCKT